MGDKWFREEHDMMAASFNGWFGMEGKSMMEGMQKKSRPFTWYTGQVKRAGDVFMTNVFFILPQVSEGRIVLGGASFDPDYLKQAFFPEMLDELITQKLSEEKSEQLAMMVFPAVDEGAEEHKAIVASAGWNPRLHANWMMFSKLALIPQLMVSRRES